MSLRAWISFAAYPVVTVGSAVAAWWLVQRGLRGDLAVGCVFLALVGIIQVLERNLAYEETWNEPRGDVLTDVLHFLFSSLGVHLLFSAMVSGALPSLGAPPVSWPHHWPFGVQVIAALAVGELGAYWLHRWMHGPGLLWRLHRIHHSALRLYAANASRNHPLDSLLILAGFALPVLWLGASTGLLATVAAFAIAHLALQHSNIDLRLGVLNRVLAGPEVHRWHHSRQPAEANANYGHVLMIWDVVFRTRRFAPTLRPPVNVGLFDDETLPESFPGHLVAAFAAGKRPDGAKQ